MTKRKETEPALTGEVIVPGEDPGDNPRLADIADEVRSEWGKGNEVAFTIGKLLAEARAFFGEGDRFFGQWFAAQEFPFGQQVAWRLRYAAEHEDEVRELLSQPKPGGKERSVDNAVRMLTAPEDDRQDPKAVKALQELVGPEKESSVYVKFMSAVSALDLSQLPDEELVSVAEVIKTLADAYNAERAARAERS